MPLRQTSRTSASERQHGSTFRLSLWPTSAFSCRRATCISRRRASTADRTLPIATSPSTPWPAMWPSADIPLAALLVPKGVVVLDPRGEEYTAESIGERLSVRNFMDGLRGAGVETGGHAAYGPREKQAFANALDRALTRALRQPR